MSLFVDTSVWLLAVGGDHPERQGCRDFLDRQRRSTTVLHVSVEVVQEFLFHRLRRTDRQTAVEQATWLRDATLVHPFDDAVLDRALRLVGTTELRGRDAIHVAVAQLAGVDAIVSLDRDFDDVPGLRRIDPADA